MDTVVWGEFCIGRNAMINGKKLVVLCAYRVYDAQVFSFISELNRLLNEKDCCLFVYALNSEIGNSGDNQAETAVFDLIPYDKADAVVIMDEKIKSRLVSMQIIKKAAKRKIPVIVVDGVYPDTIGIRFDYAAGFDERVRHVIEHHKAKKYGQ